MVPDSILGTSNPLGFSQSSLTAAPSDTGGVGGVSWYNGGFLGTLLTDATAKMPRIWLKLSGANFLDAGAP
jgi:hypothetical protein